MGRLEKEYQKDLIPRLKREFPGAIVLKNDEQYLTGIPDLTLLWQDRWAFLEVKRSMNSSYQPLQKYYLEKADEMSIARTIFPENELDVIEEIKIEWGISDDI